MRAREPPSVARSPNGPLASNNPRKKRHADVVAPRVQIATSQRSARPRVQRQPLSSWTLVAGVVHVVGSIVGVLRGRAVHLPGVWVGRWADARVT
eukprot:CAMPEP_0170225720 /NCGR_PEP_ID=MMETSP0116_2-20130129/12570_1 /TAXON_ID=400756 /ORGANISM="Durinskia baltica, Strain CSIRO CS-38" /LENGTH=94 /DNA_ID=CAMNT_0010476443 /DNA_START=197 /DNA_END=478 /DNA_ORIENTATION=-